jgi:hypothetical protein
MSIHSVESERIERPPRPFDRERSQRTVAATEVSTTFAALGLSPGQFARLLGVSPRTARHWIHGDRRPHGIIILLRLLAAQKVTLTDIAEAASPTRAPNGAQRGCHQRTAAPKPESALGAGIGLYELSQRTCRWPMWLDATPVSELSVPMLRFCGALTKDSPYCNKHATMARRPEAPSGPRHDSASARAAVRASR